MSSASMTLDDAPPCRFHYQICVFAGGGALVDGYLLGLITIALPVLPDSFHMTSFWTGMIGASSLIGLFIGASIFGAITDRIGRKKLYTIDLIAFSVCCLLQLLVANAAELFAARLVLGIAIGADYAVGPSYLSEFLPRQLRGPMLSSLAVIWRFGYLLAVLAAVALLNVGHDAWRWILVSGVVPSVIVTLCRIGSPESPRWLVRRGRRAEAEAIVARYIHPDVSIDDLDPAHDVREPHPFKQLVSRRWRGRVAFNGFFWAAQIAPSTALATFLPTIFVALGVSTGNVGTIVQNSFFLLGGIIGLFVINRIGRRRLLVSTFFIGAVALFLVAIVHGDGVVLVIACMAAYGVTEALGAGLQYVYPSELFPTSIRASGVGVSAAFSRLGSIVSTFAFPFLLDHLGISWCMAICGGILALGGTVSTFAAPETTGLSLAQTAEWLDTRASLRASPPPAREAVPSPAARPTAPELTARHD